MIINIYIKEIRKEIKYKRNEYKNNEIYAT